MKIIGLPDHPRRRDINPVFRLDLKRNLAIVLILAIGMVIVRAVTGIQAVDMLPAIAQNMQQAHAPNTNRRPAPDQDRCAVLYNPGFAVIIGVPEHDVFTRERIEYAG